MFASEAWTKLNLPSGSEKISTALFGPKQLLLHNISSPPNSIKMTAPLVINIDVK